MHTLLIRLAGPLQAWGTQSHFQIRETGTEPSKSGVVGLLAAALGRDWSVDVNDIAALRMGVRVDQEGELVQDFQTIHDVRCANGNLKPTEISTRWYLGDARFLVALTGDDLVFLQSLHAALRNPVWPLYLGRKACVPSEPPYLPDGLREETDLREALQSYPWLGRRNGQNLRLVYETADGTEVRVDQPVNNFVRRGNGPRRTTTLFIPYPMEATDVGLTSDAQPAQ